MLLLISIGLGLVMLFLKLRKWHYLLRRISTLSFNVSASSYLIGLGFELLAPARLAELARVAYLPRK